MNKIFTNLLTGCLLVGAGLTVQAAELSDFTVDKGAVTPGQKCDITTKGNYYTYTPTASGPVIFQTDYTGSINNIAWAMGGQYGVFFAFEEYTDFYMQMNATSGVQESEGWQFIFELTAGKEYIFGYPSDNSEMTAGFTFEILEEEVVLPPSNVSSVQPTPGEVIDTALYTDIQISSSSGAVTTWGEVTFTYGNESVILNQGAYAGYVTTNGYPEFLQIRNVPELINLASDAGAGSFTITVKDLVAAGVPVTLNETGNSSVTVEDGTVTITYPLESPVKYLAEESTWPATFYNYWEPGDESALATLVFNQNVGSVEEVNVMMGAVDPSQMTGGSGTTYSISPQLDGNKVILDFAGVERVDATAGQVTVEVKTVKGENGLTVNFGTLESTSNLYQYIVYKNEAAPTDQEPTEPEEPTYMSAEPTVYYDSEPGWETLFLIWDESLEAIDEEAALEATLTTPEGASVAVVMYVTTYHPEVSDEPTEDDSATSPAADNALMVQMSQYVSQYGAGEYSISFGSVVKNSAGEWNNPVENKAFTVEVPSFAEGKISPESGAIFAEGDEVLFTISFEGEVVANEDAEYVVMVYGGPEEEVIEEYYDWSLAGIVYVTADADSVVIDLGTELAAGFYQLAFFEGAVTVDGNPNQMVEANFEVSADTEGVGSLNAADGANVIYNLQGVKVQNPTKGLYIINGKKVILK